MKDGAPSFMSFRSLVDFNLLQTTTCVTCNQEVPA
jgi:hypothetical protein